MVALGRALEEHHRAHKGNIAQQARDLVLAAGYGIEEILPLLTSKGRRRAPSDSARSYPTYVDPENVAHVYARGVLPGWMKALMIEKGYDPSDKSSRESFKAEVLVRQG